MFTQKINHPKQQDFLKVVIVAANVAFCLIISVITSGLAFFQTAWQSPGRPGDRPLCAR